jgi:hypothetical protein
MVVAGLFMFWLSYDAQFQHKVIRTNWGAGWMPPEAGFVVSLILLSSEPSCLSHHLLIADQTHSEYFTFLV